MIPFLFGEILASMRIVNEYWLSVFYGFCRKRANNQIGLFKLACSKYFFVSFDIICPLISVRWSFIEMKNAVVEHERAETALVLPKVQDCFSKATKALSEYILAKDAVNSW